MPLCKHSGHALQDRAACLPRRPMGGSARSWSPYRSQRRGLGEVACATRGRYSISYLVVRGQKPIVLRDGAPAKGLLVDPLCYCGLLTPGARSGPRCLCLTRELSPPAPAPFLDFSVSPVLWSTHLPNKCRTEALRYPGLPSALRPRTGSLQMRSAMAPALADRDSSAHSKPTGVPGAPACPPHKQPTKSTQQEQ